MKRLAFILPTLLFVLISDVARADLQQEQNALITELKSSTTEFNQLKADREALATRFEVLKQTEQMVTAQVAKYKTAKEAYDIEMSAHMGVVANHNTRCHGESPDRGHVNACNTEAARLDGVTARFKQRFDGLEANRKLVLEALETQKSETEKVIAADKAARARQVEIVTRQQAIDQRLTAIIAEVDGCKAAIAAVDAHPNCDPRLCSYKEKMQAACAAMFDGNRP